MPRPFRRRGERFAVGLSEGERTFLGELCRQARDLLEHEDPSSDPAVARLFPPAYQDDPLQNLEYERNVGEAPRSGKLDAIATLERTVDGTELSEEELLAWMGVVNDARLVLGTRIEITEEATEADYPDDHEHHESFGVYVYLTWLESEMIDALGDPPVGDASGG
jgi:Domain of unknown function (DUF2017)